jgi:hypothetical protein
LPPDRTVQVVFPKACLINPTITIRTPPPTPPEAI